LPEGARGDHAPSKKHRLPPGELSRIVGKYGRKRPGFPLNKLLANAAPPKTALPAVKGDGGMTGPAGAAPAANPYHMMPKEEATAALLTAVLDDDIGTLNLIAAAYPLAHDWKVVVKGSGIGGQPIATPVIFYAVDGTGAALDWLIARGADLRAESNFALSPAVAHAASKGAARAVARLMLAMDITDLDVRMGSLHFAHLSDVARHYGHDELAGALARFRGETATVVTPQLPAPKKALPRYPKV
jgi:hypothetical protein